MGKRVIAVMFIAAAACARVMPPPGGDPDKEAPRVVETTPGQNGSVPDFGNSPVRIVFDEVISERSPREMVMVSPETGEINVDRDDNELHITIAGGWQPNRVYRITVLPGIVDRFGNARTTAYELVFSTGGTIVYNAIGGLVTDRITGRPVSNARVELISRADSTVYTTVTDSVGFYGMRSVPLGAYQTRVYVDQNRNRKLDPFEATAQQDINITSPTDTSAIELALLARDTTAARLTRAEIRDSLQVRLFFDDYADPAGGLPPMRITAWQLPDSTMIVGGAIMTPREFTAFRQRSAQRDSVRTDTTTAQQPDTARVLPINELVWMPPQPLKPGTRYRVSITGFRNLANIPDGGGSVVATAPAAPRMAPAPRDSTAPRDTTRNARPTPRDTIR